ncbi:hypothetical protein DID75_02505 [Candidatus Marinamargulisbacteria bacterium SCGC AG-410-N11]|nr:hypothetical protein DID75_02505 [Candidatus Marinamargulisbacteria bacterium SCGC AG-410-N11]
MLKNKQIAYYQNKTIFLDQLNVLNECFCEVVEGLNGAELDYLRGQKIVWPFELGFLENEQAFINPFTDLDQIQLAIGFEKKMNLKELQQKSKDKIRYIIPKLIEMGFLVKHGIDQSSTIESYINQPLLIQEIGAVFSEFNMSQWHLNQGGSPDCKIDSIKYQFLNELYSIEDELGSKSFLILMKQLFKQEIKIDKVFNFINTLETIESKIDDITHIYHTTPNQLFPNFETGFKQLKLDYLNHKQHFKSNEIEKQNKELLDKYNTLTRLLACYQGSELSMEKSKLNKILRYLYFLQNKTGITDSTIVAEFMMKNNKDLNHNIESVVTVLNEKGTTFDSVCHKLNHMPVLNDSIIEAFITAWSSITGLSFSDLKNRYDQIRDGIQYINMSSFVIGKSKDLMKNEQIIEQLKQLIKNFGAFEDELNFRVVKNFDQIKTALDEYLLSYRTNLININQYNIGKKALYLITEIKKIGEDPFVNELEDQLISHYFNGTRKSELVTSLNLFETYCQLNKPIKSQLIKTVKLYLEIFNELNTKYIQHATISGTKPKSKFRLKRDAFNRMVFSWLKTQSNPVVKEILTMLRQSRSEACFCFGFFPEVYKLLNEEDGHYQQKQQDLNDALLLSLSSSKTQFCQKQIRKLVYDYFKSIVFGAHKPVNIAQANQKSDTEQLTTTKRLNRFHIRFNNVIGDKWLSKLSIKYDNYSLFLIIFKNIEDKLSNESMYLDQEEQEESSYQERCKDLITDLVEKPLKTVLTDWEIFEKIGQDYNTVVQTLEGFIQETESKLISSNDFYRESLELEVSHLKRKLIWLKKDLNELTDNSSFHGDIDEGSDQEQDLSRSYQLEFETKSKIQRLCNRIINRIYSRIYSTDLKNKLCKKLGNRFKPLTFKVADINTLSVKNSTLFQFYKQVYKGQDIVRESIISSDLKELSPLEFNKRLVIEITNYPDIKVLDFPAFENEQKISTFFHELALLDYSPIQINKLFENIKKFYKFEPRVNEVNINNKTPLMLALELNKTSDYAKQLISYLDDKDIIKSDSNGKTAVNYAIENNKKDIFDLLVTKYPELNNIAQSDNIRHPFLSYIENNIKWNYYTKDNITPFLELKCGDNQFMPIHLAGYYKNIEMMQALIDAVPVSGDRKITKSSLFEMKTRDDKTCLEIACREGHYEFVLKVLQNYDYLISGEVKNSIGNTIYENIMDILEDDLPLNSNLKKDCRNIASNLIEIRKTVIEAFKIFDIIFYIEDAIFCDFIKKYIQCCQKYPLLKSEETLRICFDYLASQQQSPNKRRRLSSP